MRNRILVGDVGGTNVRFACAEQRGDDIEINTFKKFSGDDFPDFTSVLQAYSDDVKPDVTGACFALAGPVKNREALLTNRRWHISARDIEAQFKYADVAFINDFAAMARSVPEMADDKYERIISGQEIKNAPILVTGPGTGLGVATLLSSKNGAWQVLNGEGGHMAYAPCNQLEMNLHRYLLDKHGYVSNELVASGSGLYAVHEAFCHMYDREMRYLTPQEMNEAADAGDVMYQALCEVRAHTVMRAAGDLVLANGAMGGVVLAGGVTEHLTKYLKTDEARRRFEGRGALSDYVRGCSVKLLRDDEAPLLGAAAYYFQNTAAGER